MSTDEVTYSSKVYDQNRLRKTYPLKRLRPVYSQIVIGTGDPDGIGSGIDVETALIEFNDSYLEIYNFQKTYQSVPTIAISPEGDNVNIFVSSITNTSITIESSSPFTGKVHLQVYTEDG